MNCKKDSNDACMCMKRKLGDCDVCEKRAIEVVRESGKDLNEVIKYVKETGDTIKDLYVGLRGYDEDPDHLWFRSAIDILRGDCRYCTRFMSESCSTCMWSLDMIDEGCGEDHWVFDESAFQDS